MTIEIVVPALGESVTEATVAKWFKSAGDTVAVDEPLVELETDKVTLEVNASSAGTLAEIVAAPGANVEVGAILGRIAEAGAAPAAKPAAMPAAAAPTAAVQAAPARAAAEAPLSPAVRKMVTERDLDASAIPATGKDGRVTKGDVLAFVEARLGKPAAAARPAAPPPPSTAPAAPPAPRAEEPRAPAAPAPAAAPRPRREEAPAPMAKEPRAPQPREERVRMTRLRQRIAERLKEAQNTAAMLTTFNEVDMTRVMASRDAYKDRFEKKYSIRLGFMSFFVKACLVALKEIPAVNAEIDGDQIVYKNHYDIGVAVGTEQGLVVPVVRDVDQMGFAEIEKRIGELGRKARDGKLSIDELTGGTFTITNGGVYGSLLSTPILNPPQSGILGMHKIQNRPIAVGTQVVVRPMMYLALSYDHRIVDGREAVTFLVRVKECIEEPERILLDI
jgi:2-oxoglutarate dehydrogenase E2 component (dihydrolipoamide succinyltransferase)